MNLQKQFLIIIFISALVSFTTKKDNYELKNQIEKIIASKNADVGVSIITDNNEIISINGDKLYPMMSTFKFPIALTVLHKVENGELSMNQKIFIKNEELLENTYSPFKEKYPEGNVSITLEAALEWMVAYSDNNITDILLRLIDGTETVDSFIADSDFIIKYNEEQLLKDWDSQSVNKTTPNFYSKKLKQFSEGKILNKELTNWLYETMVKSPNGGNRLKGKLPNVRIAQKTGTSFTDDKGFTLAINNTGILELPNNKKLYITVFVTNTSEEINKAEEIIADISKVTYDYYNNK